MAYRNGSNPTTFPTLKGFAQTVDEATVREGRTPHYCARSLSDLMTVLSIEGYAFSVVSKSRGYQFTGVRNNEDGAVERLLGNVQYRRLADGPEAGTYWFAESAEADWDVLDMLSVNDVDDWFTYESLGTSEAVVEEPEADDRAELDEAVDRLAELADEPEAPSTSIKDALAEAVASAEATEPEADDEPSAQGDSIRMYELAETLGVSKRRVAGWLKKNGHKSHHLSKIPGSVAMECTNALLS